MLIKHSADAQNERLRYEAVSKFLKEDKEIRRKIKKCFFPLLRLRLKLEETYTDTYGMTMFYSEVSESDSILLKNLSMFSSLPVDTTASALPAYLILKKNFNESGNISVHYSIIFQNIMKVDIVKYLDKDGLEAPIKGRIIIIFNQNSIENYFYSCVTVN